MAIDNTDTQVNIRYSVRQRRPWHSAMVLVTGLFLVSGCGRHELEISTTSVDADKILFERGSDALEGEEWMLAREYFIQIRDNFPQSQLRADARLGVADAYTGQGTSQAYDQAATEFQNFLSFYPTHPRAPYAQYMLGLVYYRQMRRPERDQAETREAVREFEIFIQRYPTSDLIGKARTKLRKALDRLSEADFLVGLYYYNSKWYPGAIGRFRSILDRDPGYTGRGSVYFYLADSLRLTDRSLLEDSRVLDSTEGADALQLFERLVEEFPDTEYFELATRWIAELKQEPDLHEQENR